MKVVEDGKFAVYIYREVEMRHHLPHCHIRWADGSTVVTLPLLRVIAGTQLPKSGKNLLLSKLELICAAWNDINPERSI